MGTVLFGAASACSSGGGSKQAQAVAVTTSDSARYPAIEIESGLAVAIASFDYPPGDVRRYGATGLGQQDDSMAIQSALAVTRANGGGCVVLPAGTYLTADTIHATAGGGAVTLDGAGAVLRHANGQTTCLHVSGGDFTVANLRFEYAPGVTSSGDVAGLVAAIRVANCSNVVVRDCQFERLPGIAILVHGDSAPCTDVTIASCGFREVRATAVRLNGTAPAWPVSRVRILSCNFVSPGDPISAQTRAVHVGEKVADVRIAGNSLSGPARADYSAGWRDAIMIGNGTARDRPSNVIVSSNHISGMADDGIGLAGAQSVKIIGNIISGSLVTSGIYCPADGSWRNADVTIASNELKNHHLAGIYLKDTDGFSITGNQVTDCNGGIFALDTAVGRTAQAGTIANNTLQRLGSRAIHCETGTVNIAGNTILGFGDATSSRAIDRAAIFASGAGRTAMICGNVFGDGEHGVLVSGSFARLTITGNLAQGVSGYGAVFVDFVGDDWIVSGNHLTGGAGQCTGLPVSARGIFANNL